MRFSGLRSRSAWWAVAAATAMLAGARPAAAAANEPLHAEPMAGVEARTSALLLSGQRGGEVAGSLLWGVVPGAEGSEAPRVVLVAEVDGRSLLAGQRGEHIPIAVYAYAVSPEGRLAAHLAEGIVLTADRYRGALEACGLKFEGVLELVPGRYSLRVMVRNHATGAYFLTWAGVRVAGDEAGVPYVLPPFVDERSQAWVTVLGHGLDSPQLALDGDGWEVEPSALPVVSGERPTDLVVATSGLDAAARLSVSLANEQRRTVAEPELELVAAPAVTAGGVRLRRARLAPIDLPAGRYRLALAAESAGGTRTTRALPVVVAEAGATLAWAALDEADRQPREAVKEGDEAPRLGRRRLRHAYLAALRRLAEGDPFGARREVATLEREALAGGGPGALVRLAGIERAVAAELVVRRGQALVAQTVIHRELYRIYVARHEGALAAHSWRLAAELAELAARYQPRPVPAGFGEAILVGLAGDLVQGSAVLSGRGLLERALVLAPEHEGALLALGAAYERAGEYDDAAAALRRLLASHPDNQEGRLRLAVNLARTGGRGEAERLLRSMAEAGKTRWMRALAFQELARLMVDGGRAGEAETLLRGASAALPEVGRLRIELAFVLDTLGRPREAAAVVEGVGGGAPEESARLRYAAWPALPREASRRLVDEVKADAAPLLGKALAVVRGGGQS